MAPAQVYAAQPSNVEMDRGLGKTSTVSRPIVQLDSRSTRCLATAAMCVAPQYQSAYRSRHVLALLRCCPCVSPLPLLRKLSLPLELASVSVQWVMPTGEGFQSNAALADKAALDTAATAGATGTAAARAAAAPPTDVLSDEAYAASGGGDTDAYAMLVGPAQQMEMIRKTGGVPPSRLVLLVVEPAPIPLKDAIDAGVDTDTDSDAGVDSDDDSPEMLDSLEDGEVVTRVTYDFPDSISRLTWVDQNKFTLRRKVLRGSTEARSRTLAAARARKADAPGKQKKKSGPLSTLMQKNSIPSFVMIEIVRITRHEYDRLSRLNGLPSSPSAFQSIMHSAGMTCSPAEALPAPSALAESFFTRARREALPMHGRRRLSLINIGKKAGFRDKFETHRNALFGTLAHFVAREFYSTPYETNGRHGTGASNHHAARLRLQLLYGRDGAAAGLRVGKSGLLRVTARQERPKGTELSPSAEALLSVFAREHNRIATVVAAGGTGHYDDNDLFRRARRINVVQFGRLVMSDYVCTLLQTDAPSATKLADMSRLIVSDPMCGKAKKADVGARIVNSREMELLHRWHTLEMGALDAAPDGATSVEAFAPVGEEDDAPDGEEGDENKAEEFAALARLDVAIESALRTPCNAMKPSNSPPSQAENVMDALEASRTHHVCTLNQFRANLGLHAYRKFSEITPSPEVQSMLARHYSSPDRVELFVGVTVEAFSRGKKSAAHPGGVSALSLPETLSVALIAVALAALLDDPWHTTEFELPEGSPTDLAALLKLHTTIGTGTDVFAVQSTTVRQRSRDRKVGGMAKSPTGAGGGGGGGGGSDPFAAALAGVGAKRADTLLFGGGGGPPPPGAPP